MAIGLRPEKKFLILIDRRLRLSPFRLQFIFPLVFAQQLKWPPILHRYTLVTDRLRRHPPLRCSRLNRIRLLDQAH
jgi:hypothetical protein